jgi:hypothetical protein
MFTCDNKYKIDNPIKAVYYIRAWYVSIGHWIRRKRHCERQRCPRESNCVRFLLLWISFLDDLMMFFMFVNTFNTIVLSLHSLVFVLFLFDFIVALIAHFDLEGRDTWVSIRTDKFIFFLLCTRTENDNCQICWTHRDTVEIRLGNDRIIEFTWLRMSRNHRHVWTRNIFSIKRKEK